MAGNHVFLSNAQECLVVVMDVQQKLTAVMPNGVRERVLARIKALLTMANTLSVPIVVTEQYPKGLGHTEPVLSEQLKGAVPVIEKTSFSAMNAAGFAEHVEQSGRKQIVLVGMETHICILQTALDMQAAGFQVFVVEIASDHGTFVRTVSKDRDALKRTTRRAKISRADRCGPIQRQRIQLTDFKDTGVRSNSKTR